MGGKEGTKKLSARHVRNEGQSNLEEKYVKEYFRQEGTVSEWWHPEEDSNVKDRELYLSEMKDVFELVEPKDKTILDCGTGKGRAAIRLVREGAKLVIGIDISKEMLEIAKERAKKENVIDKIIFELADADNLTYRDNQFDAVICIQTLMHLPDPEKCVNELVRVVKPRGIIIADHGNMNPIWRISLRGWKNFFYSGIARTIYYSTIMYPIRRILSKFGFPQYATARGISKRKFLNLFSHSEAVIKRTIEYGPTYCPAFFLCLFQKTEQWEEENDHK